MNIIERAKAYILKHGSAASLVSDMLWEIERLESENTKLRECPSQVWMAECRRDGYEEKDEFFGVYTSLEESQKAIHEYEMIDRMNWTQGFKKMSSWHSRISNRVYTITPETLKSR